MAKNKMKGNNKSFIDASVLNDLTFIDYVNRLKKIAISIFEWVNLPSSMNAQKLEKDLFYNGMATILKDEQMGFINTNCSSNGYINIYDLPTSFNCYSHQYSKTRKLYTGINNEESQKDCCILVQNNWDKQPTFSTIQLFAYRLYQAERSIDLNVILQKFPFFILLDEQQRLTFINLINQYQENIPFIFGDKNNLTREQIDCIQTDAPFIANELCNYKKQIWNEALTFLRN